MRKQSIFTSALIPGMIFLISSCASIGNPSGGPRDEDPPRFMGANPGQGAVNFNGRRAVLHFDELINVKDAFNNVVMSPPGASVPRVSSLGNRVTIDFQDTLLPNTTYTVDFGDAIVDNNEGNKLSNFIYTFSTGPELDTLMISGMVLGSDDLEPQKGMLVGLHTNLADSAFRTQRFDRIAKTDELGRFVIGGLAPGEYRVFALKDQDNDLKYSSPEEDLAFYDVVVSPYTERTTATDSIFNILAGEVDSVVTRQRTRYLPNNILLRSYNSGFKPQYLTKYEREDSTKISLIFNSPAGETPVFSFVGSSASAPAFEDRVVIERSATNDTIKIWLSDRQLIESDTLRLAVSYLRGKSPSTMEEVSDTLRLITQRPKMVKKEKKKKGEEEEEVIPTLPLKLANSNIDIERPLRIEVETPLEALDRDKWNLQVKVDSLWENIPLPEFVKDSLNPRQYILDIPWEYDTQYRLHTDSLAVKGIYGLTNKATDLDFKTRPENEYSSITVNVTGYRDTVPAVVELLDGSGKIRKSAPLGSGRVYFGHLLTGKYYLRLLVDRNGDGKYSPGDYDTGLQPDYTYYYPNTINLKQNWSQELNWNVFGVPVNKMKPYNLLKSKPKDKGAEYVGAPQEVES